MKRVLSALIVLVTGSLMAAGVAVPPPSANPPPPPPRMEAAFIGGFWFGVPGSINEVDVIGVKLGLPISSGHGVVKGFEWTLFCGATDHIRGFQWSMAGVSMTKDIDGLQLGLVNLVEKEIKGLQMGLVNVDGRRGVQLGIVNCADDADCQIGLVNLNKNGWMPFMVGFNRSK